MEEEEDVENIKRIPIDKIRVLENIRTNISKKDLSGLMQLIRDNGLLHPVGVWKEKEGYFLAHGHRRFFACKKLGWKKIEAKILDKKLNEADFLFINTIENLCREDISPAELGRICKRLTLLEYNTKEIAAALNIPESKVIHTMQLFKYLPKEYEEEIGFFYKTNRSKNRLPVSVTNSILSLVRYNKNLRKDTDAKILLDAAKKEYLTTADIRVIRDLLESGMTLNQALKEVKKYISKHIEIACKKSVLKEELKKNRCNISEYIYKILRGDIKSNKSLVYS